MGPWDAVLLAARDGAVLHAIPAAAALLGGAHAAGRAARRSQCGLVPRAGVRAATLAPMYFDHPSEDLIQRVSGGIRYRAEAFNRALFHSAPSFNTLERLPAIRVPTLLLGGGGDSSGIATHVAHAEVRRFERIPFVKEREEFLRVVRGWLARLP